MNQTIAGKYPVFGVSYISPSFLRFSRGARPDAGAAGSAHVHTFPVDASAGAEGLSAGRRVRQWERSPVAS